MRTFTRILREPLFHFLIIGAALFGIYAAMNPAEREAAGSSEIAISPALAEVLGERYRTVWQSPPTAEIVDELIDSYIEEEVLVRQARALSLDVGDSVIRQRLAQKMSFLNGAAATTLDPSDEELAAFRAENPAAYRLPPRVAFDQIYLGDTPQEEDMAVARARLDAGEDPAAIGVRSLLPAAVPPATLAQVDGTFGRGMFEAVLALPASEWTGPVTSSFGAHLIRVNSKTEAAEPPLSDVREALLRDFLAAKTQALADEQIAALVSEYSVSRPSRADLEAMLK